MNRNNGLTAWGNWARQTFITAANNVMHGGRVVQTVHLTFTESAAKSLNESLDSKIADSDVKGVKAILFNMTTVTLVATVAFYLLGSMSFLGAAALIALSLVGRAIVVESFDSITVEFSIRDESRQSLYLQPESLYTVFGTDLLYKMDPIVRIFSDNVRERQFTNAGFGGIQFKPPQR
jgi:hypothetical protein